MRWAATLLAAVGGSLSGRFGAPARGRQCRRGAHQPRSVRSMALAILSRCAESLRQRSNWRLDPRALRAVRSDPISQSWRPQPNAA